MPTVTGSSGGTEETPGSETPFVAITSHDLSIDSTVLLVTAALCFHSLSLSQKLSSFRDIQRQANCEFKPWNFFSCSFKKEQKVRCPNTHNNKPALWLKEQNAMQT